MENTHDEVDVWTDFDIPELQQQIEGYNDVIEDMKYCLEQGEITEEYANNIIVKEQKKIDKNMEMIDELKNKGIIKL